MAVRDESVKIVNDEALPQLTLVSLKFCNLLSLIFYDIIYVGQVLS